MTNTANRCPTTPSHSRPEPLPASYSRCTHSGVPHIYAQNEHDLFFAQGYAHAQDRLWQMEFNRRVGRGTLSAVLGEATLETDRYLRTLGLRRAAERDLASADPEIRALLQAYADGINADIRDIHAQTYSLPAEALRPYLLAIQPEDELQAKALALVESWDLYLEADRPGASIYQTWYWFLVQHTLRDVLGDDLLSKYQNSYHLLFMIDLMPQADSPWFDDKTTPQIESRDDIVYRSLVDALAWLSSEVSQDATKWEWGRLHSKTFVHQPLGQSGHLFHPNREDMIPLWQNVEYHAMPFSRDAVENKAKSTLTLAPP